MKKIYRLKSNLQYKQTYKKGSVVTDGTLTLIFVKYNSAKNNGDGRNTAKFGFNITGKYGKAVKRNKLRRQLKYVCSLVAPDLSAGTYIFRPRFFAEQAPEFLVLKNSALELLQKTQK